MNKYICPICKKSTTKNLAIQISYSCGYDNHFDLRMKTDYSSQNYISEEIEFIAFHIPTLSRGKIYFYPYADGWHWRHAFLYDEGLFNDTHSKNLNDLDFEILINSFLEHLLFG